MTREDISRIASEYFDDKESEHEMDEVFDLAKKSLEERKEDMLDKIRAEILVLDDADYDFEGYYKAVTDALKIIDKYKAETE